MPEAVNLHCRAVVLAKACVALCASLLTALCIAGPAAGAATVALGNSTRYKALERVIDKNIGHTHMRRGVDVCTILALHTSVTERDLTVLGDLVESDNALHRRAAAFVLSVMGEPGALALEARGGRLSKSEIKRLIDRAEETKEAIARHRESKSCKLKLR